MSLKKVPAKNRGNCIGCYCYCSGRVRPEHKFHQECLHGGFHTPEECYKNNTILIKTKGDHHGTN